jgi:hypothetical protein
MNHTSRGVQAAAALRRGVKAPLAAASGREMGPTTIAVPGRGVGAMLPDAAPGREVGAVSSDAAPRTLPHAAHASTAAAHIPFTLLEPRGVRSDNGKRSMSTTE